MSTMELKTLLALICAALALYLTYKLLRTIHSTVAPRLAARGWFGIPPPPPPPTKNSPSPYIKSPKSTTRGNRRNSRRSNRLTSSSARLGTPGVHIRHSPAPASATPTRGILTPEKGTFGHTVARSRRAGLRVGFAAYVSIDADPALDKYPMKAPAPILKAALPVAVVEEVLGGVSAKVYRRAERRLRRRTVAVGGVLVDSGDGRGAVGGEVVGGCGGSLWGLWDRFVGVWREEVDWEHQLELWTAVVVVSAVLKIVGAAVDGLGWFAMGVGAMCGVVVAVGVGLGIVGRKEW